MMGEAEASLRKASCMIPALLNVVNSLPSALWKSDSSEVVSVVSLCPFTDNE